MSAGRAVNGADANDAALNGATGHAVNGTATNGLASNGHGTNGHAANGVAVKASPAKETTNKKNGATKGRATVEPVVKLTGVAKSFGRNAVLKEINLTVAPGELVEVIGPSGAGKTTLLRLVHGQLRPSRGQVLVQGRGLHRWWRRGLGRIRRDVAFVFQEHHLLPRLTAFENLTLALQVT
ncbi:MAG TPA: ATP-binding cassette domain-containing protein, partial [Candidatus Dormibacteraeota bacterium]|nr:ATP-binding cassette domain-containing protein [Candidatus Dormibacteraeota bacterium]